MKVFCFFAFVLLLSASAAEARVFNFDQQTFSTYLRGTYGFTKLQEMAYQSGFPTTVVFDSSGSASTAYSGEFGLAFTSPHAMTFRLGVELLSPAQQTGVQGKDSTGTTLLSLDSQVYSIIPQANFEFFVKKGATWRWYFGGGAGYAVTTFKNTVTMTSAGQTALGVGNYIEEGTGWGIMGQAITGYEFSIFDTVSLSFDLGYRYLVVNNYTANRDYVAPAGTFTTGNPVKNVDGSARSTDLSGFFAGATFRFYIN
jgi:hypothetical protein